MSTLGDFMCEEDEDLLDITNIEEPNGISGKLVYE